MRITRSSRPESGVALHPEGVDRNIKALIISPRPGPSPSTRRAWIEIKAHPAKPAAALSPSTRRAWIEIVSGSSGRPATLVALHPEGVDRNIGRVIR